MDTFEYQVSVPDEFFQKSKSEYNDWRFAFVRELIQNSFDAQATEIRFTQSSDEHNNTVIDAIDDGSGMDKDTLINVLLALGGSKKPAGSVGGFGYAKHILFFSHISYSIRSNEHLVEGKGGHYNIRSDSPFVKGTHVTVTMDALGTGMESLLESYLSRYAKFMNPDREFAVYFNNFRLKNSPTIFTYAIDHDLGTLRFDDDNLEKTMSLCVTVHGLPMFWHREYNVDRGCKGILELKGVSYDVLTTNREGFRGDMRQSFVDLVRRIVVDNFTLKRKPKIKLGFNIKSEIATVLTDTQHTNIDFPTNFIVHAINIKTATTSETITGTINVLKKVWVGQLGHAWKYYVYSLLCTKFAQDNLLGQIVNKGVKIKPDIDDIEIYLRQIDDGQLKFLDKEHREILPGFCLDPEAEGVNLVDAGLRLVMLNPNFYDKKFKHGDLIDLVSHEVTHLGASGHGDTFIEFEMKLRRSFRRMVSEVSLRKSCKAYLESV